MTPIRLERRMNRNSVSNSTMWRRLSWPTLFFRLARNKAVNHLEDMLHLARLLHRQAAAQHGKQHDQNQRDQNLHHHEIGPWFGGIGRFLMEQCKQPVSKTGKVRVEQLCQPGFMSDHK